MFSYKDIRCFLLDKRLQTTKIITYEKKKKKMLRKKLMNTSITLLNLRKTKVFLTSKNKSSQRLIDLR